MTDDGLANLSRPSLLRLAERDCGRVQPLFADLERLHLHVSAVLEGVCPGEVMVDDVCIPRTAYISSGDACYLAGAPGNGAFNAAVRASLPRDTYFVLFCEHERWGHALDDLLEGTYAVRARRRYHVLERHKLADWRQRVPTGFVVQSVDATLLARGLANGDDVRESVLEEWGRLENFYERGFGFCMVHDECVVSRSIADYVKGERCEIGIYTDWEYRRRGLGSLTAAATAAEALKRGFTEIGWHCWDNNVGSIRVAEKVGFKKKVEYDVFINHWAAENVSDMSPQEFRAFAQNYEREFEALPPDSGFPHVVAAKAWALGGDREACFKQLHKAVDLGWLRDIDHLRKIWPEFFFDPDLEQHAAWKQLAERLNAR